MKNYRLFTRSAIVGMSLVLVSSLLPVSVFAKKSGGDETSKTKSSKTKHSSKKSKKEETNTSTTTTSTTSGIADPKSDELLHQLSSFYSGLKSWKTRLI
jgi:hypothetical protein